MRACPISDLPYTTNNRAEMPYLTGKIVSIPTDMASDTRAPLRLGPWLLKRAYTDSSVSEVREKKVDDEQPSLRAFLEKVDNQCITIEKLQELDRHDSCQGEARQSQRSRQQQPHIRNPLDATSSCTGTTSLTQISTQALPKTSVFAEDDATTLSDEVDRRPRPPMTIRSANVIFPLALTATVNVIALIAQFYLYARVEGTKIVLPDEAPSKNVIGFLLALMAMSNGFVISFAWVSVYTVSRGCRTSYIRFMVNVVAALFVGILFTLWTLLTLIPMLKEQR